MRQGKLRGPPIVGLPATNTTSYESLEEWDAYGKGPLLGFLGEILKIQGPHGMPHGKSRARLLVSFPKKNIQKFNIAPENEFLQKELFNGYVYGVYCSHPDHQVTCSVIFCA